MKKPNNSKLITSGILFISIFLLASSILFTNIDKTDFHADEPGWIASGYYYTNLLLQGDFQWEKWKCPQCGPWGSAYNPHLGQWAIGITLKAFPAKGEQEFFNFYNFDLSYKQNKAKGNIPAQPLLLRARSVTVVFSLLCCLLIGLIGYYSHNLWIGGIAAILLIFNKIFIVLSTQALTDLPYNFFLLCACLASIVWLQQSRPRYILVTSFLYGSLIGLASSVKITGVLVGGLFFFSIILYKQIIGNLKLKDAVKCFATFSFSAIAIIYLLNPFFWVSLKEIRGTEVFLEVTTFYQEVQEGKFQKENFKNEYPQLANFSHLLEFPLMFARWNKLMNNQLREPKFAAQWGENRFITFHQTFLEDNSSFPLEFLFLFLGIILYGSKIANSIHTGTFFKGTAPFFYFVVNYVFILLFMKLNWHRYYLPTLIASKIIVAGGIYESIKFIWAKYVKKIAKF